MSDNAAFRDRYHELLRAATPGVLTRLVAELHSNGDAKEMIRFLEHATKTLGAEADRKVEAGAGLPVFNFVFNNGGVQASAVMEKVQEVIDNAAAQPALTDEASEVIEDVQPRPMHLEIKPLDLSDLDDVLGLNP